MAAKSDTFVIVGGGLAGAKAAEALRDNDFDGEVIVFAAEQHLPYERPPLSKEYLAGKKALDEFTANPAAWYRDHHVDLRLGTPVSSVDSQGHLVGLPDESTVHYDKLLLATGSAPRRPPIPGTDADRVHYLRTVDDADALNTVLTEGSSLAVVGGGWIGLEVAAGARERGVNVTVVEAAELPLLGALGRELAEVFAKLHREHGVDLRLVQRSRRSPPPTAPRPACDSVTVHDRRRRRPGRRRRRTEHRPGACGRPDDRSRRRRARRLGAAHK